jgi:small G protein signaling modulator 3
LAKLNPNILRMMRHILVSYTKRNPLIGYVQGMNFILSKIVETITKEEEAFWVFVMILEKILPIDYYSNLMGVRADSIFFADICMP